MRDRPMRDLRLFLVSLVLTSLGTFYGITFYAIALPAQAASVQIELADSPGPGERIVYLYQDPDRFGAFREPDYRARFVAGEPIEVNAPSGDYAVLVFYDENGNGELDRNFVGIPSEPIALSNNYRPKGPPSFSQARITLREESASQQTLSLYRPLGGLGQWGIGLGAIVQSSPYRDSDANAVQPIPTLVYLGERLQWTGPRVRYTLVSHAKWRLAAQGDLRLGAYEETDSPWLTGLGDRDHTVMLGLALTVDLPASASLTLSVSQDILDRSGGALARLSLSRGFQWQRLRITPSLGATWLNDDLTAYEFGVPLDNALDWRPAYAPGSAINPEVGLSLFYELSPQWQLLGFAGAEQLDEGLRDSPIVDAHTLTRGFVSLTYTF
ncbi:MipA/OmpV family protein [Marinimicrobium sp. ARAG 43.8]|uniref:MipA/OmpV family protein n=1 Tax=Marinimicrobium sp. ARAG 43.8 TaxID=3418719 RepID=UPI003CFB1E94